MNAKSKADFINSVAQGKVIPCPECGASNDANGTGYCTNCGAKLTVPQEENKSASAFDRFSNAAETDVPVYVEPNNVFAEGLPEWDIVPPQIMVRRR